MKKHLLFLLILTLFACHKKQEVNTLFRQVSSKESGISFKNEIENTPDFNIFSYRNFYNGAGVAIGDINMDGLSDIYFTSNMGENKLYLNKGNFKFEDITQKAGVAGTKAWSTGVVMVDINADGLLDIYVCNAGYVKGDNQENELFINNGDLTFTESATQYQLNEKGYTTHAAFFDYDQDGDLDCYILNNSFMPVNTLNYSNKRDLYAEDWPVKDFLKGGGDKLLRNDNGLFNDVTKEANIYGSLIGFGLGITIGDVNGDNWLDMYVSNDFFERDYLYLNQKDGTFKEDIKNWMQHLSLSSMGADMADINNDGYPEIFVTEMLPEDDYRLKTTTLFENYNTYSLKLKRDFYHQYMQNTLQLNNKDQSFSEIAHYSGVAASDWSWGALLFDADNDTYRDIYICNGVYQDVTDQDFMNFFANDIVQKMALTGEKEEMTSVIEKMPSNPQINKFFKNNKDLTFKDNGIEWGINTPSFSNGAAYGDLDNDGDLDLVVNNLNSEAFIYQNQADILNGNHYLSIQLKGKDQNTFAIGSKVYVYIEQEKLNFQLIPTRGFQSSVDYKLVFGLGTSTEVDSLVIIWPDQQKTVLQTPPVDTLLQLDESNADKLTLEETLQQVAINFQLEEVSNDFEAHKEDRFIDFYNEGLTMRMLSREGPKMAIEDVNKDGRADVFIGGASGQPGKLYLQTKKETFKLSATNTFDAAKDSEDTAILFFDADGDQDMDLFVGSGGNHKGVGTPLMRDRLYINQGNGQFILKEKAFSINGFNTAVAVPLDFDEDGDMDLFVGSRSIPNVYGMPARSFLYENDGNGQFKDIAGKVNPSFQRLGMVTDAQLVNLTGDAKKELVIIGEWMSPKIFEIEKGAFKLVESNLADYSGWWYALEQDDIDQDGDQDLILGNRGENFYFTGSREAPAKLWLRDVDNNGTIEKIITQNINGKDMPVPSKRELTDQVALLKKQNLKHTEYAKRSIQELFSTEMLKQAIILKGNYFKTAIALNEGNGNFQIKPLPREVQFSCVCDIQCVDLDKDGKKDLILGGNDDGFMPQFSKLDASYSHILLNKGAGNYKRIGNEQTHLKIKGSIKQIEPIQIGNQEYFIVGINNEQPRLFSFK